MSKSEACVPITRALAKLAVATDIGTARPATAAAASNTAQRAPLTPPAKDDRPVQRLTMRTSAAPPPARSPGAAKRAPPQAQPLPRAAQRAAATAAAISIGSQRHGTGGGAAATPRLLPLLTPPPLSPRQQPSAHRLSCGQQQHNVAAALVAAAHPPVLGRPSGQGASAAGARQPQLGPATAALLSGMMAAERPATASAPPHSAHSVLQLRKAAPAQRPATASKASGGASGAPPAGAQPVLMSAPRAPVTPHMAAPYKPGSIRIPTAAAANAAMPAAAPAGVSASAGRPGTAARPATSAAVVAPLPGTPSLGSLMRPPTSNPITHTLAEADSAAGLSGRVQMPLRAAAAPGSGASAPGAGGAHGHMQAAGSQGSGGGTAGVTLQELGALAAAALAARLGTAERSAGTAAQPGASGPPRGATPPRTAGGRLMNRLGTAAGSTAAAAGQQAPAAAAGGAEDEARAAEAAAAGAAAGEGDAWCGDAASVMAVCGNDEGELQEVLLADADAAVAAAAAGDLLASRAATAAPDPAPAPACSASIRPPPAAKPPATATAAPARTPAASRPVTAALLTPLQPLELDAELEAAFERIKKEHERPATAALTAPASGISILSAPEHGMGRFATQAAPLVLVLDNLAASTPEVLEAELDALSLDELKALRDRLAGA